MSLLMADDASDEEVSSEADDASEEETEEKEA